MTRVALEVLVGIAALGAAIASGYRAMGAGKRLQAKLGEGVAIPQDKVQSAFGKLPLVTGAIVGLMLVAVFAGSLASGDRFYRAMQAARIAIAGAGGVFLIAYGMLILTFLFVSRHYKLLATDRKAEAAALFERFEQRQWLRRFVLVLLAAVLVVWAGVRFEVATILPGRELDLGWFAPYLTVFYIVLATYAVVLLNGIHGAPNLLLLVASVLVFFWTIGGNEYFLAAFAIVLIGASLGSLRFNLHPARLPMDLDGTAVAGFLFATLTVLSRQKTMAAMLLLLPLMLIVIVLGGMMLSGLEKTIGMDSAEKK